MPKRMIENVDIELKNDEQVKAVLNNIAQLYSDPYRVIYEYIQNSVDSAHQLRLRHGKNDFPYPIRIIASVNIKKGAVSLYDNCTGIDMETFRGLANRIFISSKKSLPWAAGRFGFGVHSFRAFFNKITFITRTQKSGPSFEISFLKDKIKGNPINELTGEENPFRNGETGTIVKLEKLIRKKVGFKSFSHIKLQQEIELHFENVVREKNLTIEVRKKGYVFKCKPFDYKPVKGEFIDKEIPVKVNGKEKKIKIYLKVTEEPFKERLPRFTCKNIRVNEIVNCPSFRKYSDELYLWENPNLIGFIEVGDLLDPELERSDFPAGVEREALYAKIKGIEPEIKKLIHKITEKRNVESLNKFGNLLEDIFSKIAKEDAILLRERLRKARKGELPELFVSEEGGAEVFGEGGPGPGPGGTGGTGGLGPGSGEGLGASGEGLEVGDGVGGIGTTETKTGTGVKKRRSSGFSIKFKNLGEESPMAVKVKEEFGDIILVNVSHKNWKEREGSSKSGKIDLSDGRIPAYCAQLIVTFYIQARNDKYKDLPPHICDDIFFRFTDIVCRAEALLYKNRALLKKFILKQTKEA